MAGIDYPTHPRKLVTLKPKTAKSTGAGQQQLLSCWWDAYRKQLGLKDFSPKSQDAVALQQIKERGALPSDWSWWYPSGNRPLQQYLGFTAGRWLWSVRARLTAWLQNSKKRAERSESTDVWAESPRLSPLWLSASSACHGHIITVITPLPTKPSATKMPENWSWRTRQLLTCRCVSVMLLRSMQNTRSELADAKAENGMLMDDAGRRRLHIVYSLSVSAWSSRRLRRG